MRAFFGIVFVAGLGIVGMPMNLPTILVSFGVWYLLTN